MAKEQTRTWEEIATEAEMWAGRAVHPVSINLAAECEASLARISAEVETKLKSEKGEKLEGPELSWRTTAMEYAKVSQLKVNSRSVTQRAGFDADLVRLGKK